MSLLKDIRYVLRNKNRLVDTTKYIIGGQKLTYFSGYDKCREYGVTVDRIPKIIRRIIEIK